MLETKTKSTVRSDWAGPWLWAADEDLELGLPGGTFSMTHPGLWRKILLGLAQHCILFPF